MDHEAEISLLKDSESEIRKSSLKKLQLAVLLTFAGWSLATTIIPNQILKQSCFSFGYNSSDCLRFDGQQNVSRDIEEAIQPFVARINMTMTLLSSIVPAFLCLFVGPWSDRFGRKKAICVIFIGMSMSMMSFTLISMIVDHVERINPWVYAFAIIPSVVTGGMTLFFVLITCYVSDVTTKEKRSFELTIIQGIFFISFTLGTASSTFIMTILSLTTIFIICTVLVTIATAYTILFLDETVKLHGNLPTRSQLSELFSVTPAKDMLRTCFKERPSGQRAILWCLILVLVFSDFIDNGSSTIFYLFVREKFEWTLRDLTMYFTYLGVISMVSGFIGLVILKKFLKFSDFAMMLIAITSDSIDAIFKSLAQSTTQMYISSIFTAFGVLTVPMCGSIITSIIPSNEVGKVFSITSAFKTFSGLIAAPLYAIAYANTFLIFVGAFFLITAFVQLAKLTLALSARRIKRNYENLINDCDIQLID